MLKDCFQLKPSFCGLIFLLLLGLPLTLYGQGWPSDEVDAFGSSPQETLNVYLRTAACGNYLIGILITLDEGADIETCSQAGTPLCIAASQGHLKAVKLLIKKGARKTATDCNNLTPLQLAELHKHKKVIEFLKYSR